MNQEFQQVLTYLYGLLPMYQRHGNVAIHKNLHNTLELCRYFGDPHKKFKSIHIAGTNGKGSCSHMIASVLQEAGYHTGLYTSPHLKSFTERIRIDGACVPEDYVVEFVRQHKPVIERIMPSFFEFTVVMAFQYFAESEVDVAVIEVGMGGRLDSTNVIFPEVSLITNIGMDHAEILGDSLPKIAFEKAGVIKLHKPVVVSEYQEEVAGVFEKVAAECDSPLYMASRDICCENVKSENFRLVCDVMEGGKPRFTRLVCDLAGAYQVKNLPGVIKTLDVLPPQDFVITENALRRGLASVKQNTGLKGRWQILRQEPLTVCDTGHNEEGIKEVVKCIAEVSYSRLFIIMGVVKEKDPKKLFIHLPLDATYYFCEPDLPRKLPAAELSRVAESFGIKGRVVPNVNDAIAAANADAGKDDMIFIGGSNFVVAEIDNL